MLTYLLDVLEAICDEARVRNTLHDFVVEHGKAL